MRLLHEESGFTLVELLVAMAIMIGVLGATLGTLQVFGSNAATNQRLVVAQDQARLALDQIARELRNGTAYTTDVPQPSAVVRALPWDLIVQTVNPQPAGAGNQNTLNLMRVRYCLDTSGGNLWRQAQTWATATSPAVIADTSCPSTSWTNRRVVASNVVNGGGRRVFTYNQGSSGDVNEPAPSVEDISSVRVALWVDLDPARAPAETQLATGVFLRNKNRRPVADCSAAATGHGHVSLNGSHSSDPEGGVLTFAWADGTTPISGSGSLVDYVSPTTGPHYFTLTVTDPGGLPSQFTCQVNVL